MITSAYLTMGSCGTRGYSESATFITEQINRSQKELRKPEFYFSLMKKVYPELLDLTLANAKAGWDGFNARPVLSETYYQAIAFLESLPNTISAPSVGAEPDGHITLEWYRSPHRTLSVSIAPGGDLHYAALLGHVKAYGTEVFFGEAPKVIVDLIRRV